MVQKSRGATYLVVPVLILTATVVGYLVFSQTRPEPATSNTQPQPLVGEPVTPTVSNEDLDDLPTITPVDISTFEGDPNDLIATTSKSVYSEGDKMEITITNNSSVSVIHYVGPGCDIGFERKDNGNWKTESLYLDVSKAPCVPEQIKPGSEWKKSIIIFSDASTGTYRAAFEYVEGTIYSNEFQII